MKQKSTMEKKAAVNCNVFDYCAGNHMEEVRCWEVARSNCDFQYVFNVCSDCIVYLYEQETMNFSRKDIELILQKRKPLLDN